MDLRSNDTSVESTEMNARNQSTKQYEAFPVLVRKSFAFLVNEYGFTACDEGPTKVHYKKPSLCLVITWEPYSYEIDIEFRYGHSGDAFGLYEVVMALAPTAKGMVNCGGADSDTMARCLDQLSQLCQMHLQRVLAQDKATWERVGKTVEKMRQQYTLEAEYGAVKDRANLAWEQKDWDKARELYQKAKPALTAGEQRRLEFLAKKNAD